jgi:hypothetical protein
MLQKGNTMLTCKLIVIIGNAILVLAWPIGYLLGVIASRSSDAAGKGYAVLTVWAFTVALTYILVSVVFAVTGHVYWARMTTGLKVFLWSPAWITGGAILIGIITGVGIALDLW